MPENGESSNIPQPEFDGGSYTISHFSKSPEGFEFQSRESISRKQTPLNLDPTQKERLKAGVINEMRFQKVDNVRSAIESLAEGTGTQEELDEARKVYIKGMAGKIGMRNIKKDGNVISADVKLVSFPATYEFASGDNSPEILDWSMNAAVAMIVRSSDGRLLIQHRAIEHQKLDRDKPTRGNAMYAGIPGASAAGMLDATIESSDRKKGTPDPVDTDFAKKAILKEAGEELGLGPEDFENVVITGVSQDRVKLHDELLWFAESKLTAEEIREKSRTSTRNKDLGDADFEEKFIDIDASPEAIGKLLTEVRCPLPPTHSAALVAAGYSLLVQEQGEAAANAWKIEMEKGIKKNYRIINQTVKEFYDKYPEALTQVPERFWGKNVPVRNLHGYTPAYGPEEQGLPSFEDEMVRTGLIPETRRQIDSAYLFDVDGVLTDPTEKRVTEEELLDQIIKRLHNGEVVGLNTGRSTEWMVERLINPLVEKIDDKAILENFVAIGEKGGTWITFNREGDMHHGKVSSLALPEELKDKVSQLINEKYSDSMFFDSTKETMISTEMIDGFDLPTYTSEQARLAEDMRILLEETGGQIYRIDPTTIATDIESPNVGKALGADRFLQFLKDKDVVAQKIETFGDSKSDMAMADELKRKGKNVKLVYVGKEEDVSQANKEYEVEYVGGYTQGTLKYLQRAA